MKPFIVINSIRRKCIFCVFDISNQKDHIPALPFCVKFEFFETRAVNVLDYTSLSQIEKNNIFNIRTFIVAPCFCEKTNLMRKIILSSELDRPDKKYLQLHLLMNIWISILKKYVQLFNIKKVLLFLMMC